MALLATMSVSCHEAPVVRLGPAIVEVPSNPVTGRPAPHSVTATATSSGSTLPGRSRSSVRVGIGSPRSCGRQLVRDPPLLAGVGEAVGDVLDPVAAVDALAGVPVGGQVDAVADAPAHGQ